MNSIKRFLLDLCNITGVNLKLILKNRAAFFVLLSGVIIFTIISGSLVRQAEEKGSIPIGIIDYDQTSTSKKLVNNIKKIDAFYVYDEKKESLEKKMKDEYIEAYFVIKEGFEKRISSDDTDELIDMYFLKDNTGIPILTDIFAQEMIYDISLAKSIRMYQTYADQDTLLPKTKDAILSEAEYASYVDRLKETPSYDFSFDMELVNVDTDMENDMLSNGLMYKQMVIDLICALFSFFIMFLVYGIKKERILKQRVSLTFLNNITLEMGGVLSIMIVMGVIGSVFSFYLSQMLSLGSAILGIMSLTFFFCFVLAEFFMLLCIVATKDIIYQLLGSLTILIFGGVAGFSLLGSFLPNNIMNLIKSVPNYWFIKGITDIIVIGNSEVKLGDINAMFFVAGIVIAIGRTAMVKIKCEN